MSPPDAVNSVVTVRGDQWLPIGGYAFKRGHSLEVRHVTPYWVGHACATCAWCHATIWVVGGELTRFDTRLALPCPSEPIYLAAMDIVEGLEF